MLEITEIFRSLQGEGPFMGRPAVFVRLSRCVEPFCPWCDTPEGLKPGTQMTVGDVADRIDALGGRFVVITGGEPLRQWPDHLERLEDRLIQKGYALQYETSGKIHIPATCRGFMVCSPKFIEGQWHFPGQNAQRVDAFKFVVRHDYDAVRAFIRDHGVAADKVWIMPRGASRAEQLEYCRPVWEFCVAHGYNYSPRLHILTFDRQRGV